MSLSEAIAVYLYLQNSEDRRWNNAIFSEAWGVICQSAEHTMGGKPTMPQEPKP